MRIARLIFNHIFLGDAIDKMEDLVQNKMSELDDIATNLDFGEDDDELESPKRQTVVNPTDPKKRKLDQSETIETPEPEIDTQEIEEQIDSETTSSDFESEYEY